MPPPYRLGDEAIEAVVVLARREAGIVTVEIEERFDVHRTTALRFMNRLVDIGYLTRSGERRRRPELFDKATGAGGFIYRATQKRLERSKWASLQRWRRKRE